MWISGCAHRTGFGDSSATVREAFRKLRVEIRGFSLMSRTRYTATIPVYSAVILVVEQIAPPVARTGT